MDRRAFLKVCGVAAGAFGASGLLASCAADGPVGGLPSGDPTWSVLSATYEMLTGSSRRFAFGLLDSGNAPVRDRDVQVFITDEDANVLSGPYAAEFHDEGGSPLGLYMARIDIDEPGPARIAVVAGSDHGTAAVNVVEPSESELPVPGGEPTPSQTPTTADDMGVARVCTQEPPCGMHEVSLDEALAEGRPVALLFATPAFCQTVVCGPAVGTVDEVRTSRDWGDVVFIHVEIYSDDGRTLSQPVAEWELPSEPWLFTIDADGHVADRMDGPMVSSEVAAMVTEISGVS